MMLYGCAGDCTPHGSKDVRMTFVRFLDTVQEVHVMEVVKQFEDGMSTRQVREVSVPECLPEKEEEEIQE